MSRLHEQRWLHILLGYAFFTVLLGIATRYAWLAAPPTDRVLVIRAAAALFTGIVVWHACRANRLREENCAPSFTEAAGQSEPSSNTIDPAFLRLRDQLRISIGSADYFKRVFWPQLVELTAARRGAKPGSGITPLAMPPLRQFMKRGPRLRDLEHLVDEIERRQ
ncbi:MAG: hypothetical protein ACRET0_11725 [Steroidobacteraceae bacterium]